MLALLLLLASPAHAGTDVGGYFRVAARPDLQGGDGALGYWNLYGRLMNERSWGVLDLRMDLAEPVKGSDEPWTRVHARIEGGSIGAADAGNGTLDHLRLSQVYVEAGNVLIPGVTWQMGTLDWYMGDLGLYDFRPASLFHESVGLSGHVNTDHLELLFGFGDAGFTLHPDAYNTILTPGAAARLRLGKLELGGGGQAFLEPQVTGKRSAPYATPGLDYEDWLRGEVAQNWLAANPGQEDLFPNPVATSAHSYKLIGYVGFGGFGPVVWNNLFLSYGTAHPERSSSELFNGRAYTLYTTELTDQRARLEIGDELQLKVIPDRYDIAWGAYYASFRDADNTLAPSDHNRVVASTVLRNQVYLTTTTHLLVEGSLASERSVNGNAYRQHADSIFRNTSGTADSHGFEYGDADTRVTVQGKGGLVLNPLGPGIFSRPSLRLLYGAQYSTQNNAFGNDFVESLDQYNDFGNVERHLHHMVSLETEVWF